MSISFLDGIILAANTAASCLAIYGLYLDLRNRRASGRAKPPLIAGREKDDLDIRRRRAAKRFNERLKLLAAFLNTVGAASLLTIFVVPLATLDVVNEPVLRAVSGLGIAALLHTGAQLVLIAWKSEE